MVLSIVSKTFLPFFWIEEEICALLLPLKELVKIVYPVEGKIKETDELRNRAKDIGRRIFALAILDFVLQMEDGSKAFKRNAGPLPDFIKFAASKERRHAFDGANGNKDYKHAYKKYIEQNRSPEFKAVLLEDLIPILLGSVQQDTSDLTETMRKAREFLKSYFLNIPFEYETSSNISPISLG